MHKDLLKNPLVAWAPTPSQARGGCSSSPSAPTPSRGKFAQRSTARTKTKRVRRSSKPMCAASPRPAPIRRRSHRPAAPPLPPLPSLPISLPPLPSPVILPYPPPPPPLPSARPPIIRPPRTLRRSSAVPALLPHPLAFIAGPISPPLRRRRFRARSPPPAGARRADREIRRRRRRRLRHRDVRHRLPHQCRCRRRNEGGSESPLPSTPFTLPPARLLHALTPHFPVRQLHLLEYVITGITILAVAVPEGLLLAVTLALATRRSR